MINLYFGFHNYKLQGENVMQVEILYLKRYKREQPTAVSESYLDPDF